MGDKDGRIYDPRAGLGGYHRYGPRKLVQLCNYKYSKREDDEVTIERPKIHETVFRRIVNQCTPTRPSACLPPTTSSRATARSSADQYGFETTKRGKGAGGTRREHVWNEVWKRRILYFATVGATASVAGVPLISGAQRAD